MAYSQMDVVASLGALLRWRRLFLAERCLWLCLAKQSKVERDLASLILNSCKRRFSKLSGIFCFFDFFLSTISIF
jgi:hypothetical protein